MTAGDMTWSTPGWYGLLLLAGAAYRCWLLLAVDDISAPLRTRLDERVSGWLDCPWCAGAWLSAGWWIAYQLSPRWCLLVAVPFVVSLLVGWAARV